MSKSPAPSRPSRSDSQRQAILDAACLLFIEKGVGGTNINDIADAVGMTRTALYYYFPSKEAMLEALAHDVTERASALSKQVALQAELPPDEGLRQLILRHAELILSHPLQFRAVERSESSLPDAQRNIARSARRAVRDDFVAMIERGIAQGMFLPIDAKVAAFSIIGMCNWGAWWFDSRSGAPVEPLAELIADLGLRMIRVDAPGSRTGGSGRAREREPNIGRALEMMRLAIGALEGQADMKR